VEYFERNSPFCFYDNIRLVSLSSGVIAVERDCVTSDRSETVGSLIQDSWDGKCFTDITFKRSEKVKSGTKRGKMEDKCISISKVQQCLLLYACVTRVRWM
jgi:hypothetical protein